MPEPKPEVPPPSNSRAKSRALAKHGGSRPGAGRRTSEANAFIADVNAATRAKIVAVMPRLLDALIHLAEGVTVGEDTDDGAPRVYARPPDFRAASYLVDRVLGRPTQAVQMTGADGGPVETVNIYVPSNSRDALPPPGHPPE